jgi:tripartite-type tricarboxylate transporter receptor subunit TctC
LGRLCRRDPVRTLQRDIGADRTAPHHQDRRAERLNFNFIRDSVASASINRIPIVLEASPSFAAKSAPELIAYAKLNPAKVSLATPTKGTAPQMAAELFKIMTAVDVVPVPYRGDAPMITDLLGGQVQVGFGGISASIEQIRSGKLRALAVATAECLPALPDVPTIGESVPGYEASGWCGVVAPRNTPGAIVEKLNAEINAGLADPMIKARLSDLLAPVLRGSPPDFGNLIAAETEKWAKVIKSAGLTPE